MSGHERGLPGLMLQFLAWVALRPRSYADTMDAWRTSCPRLSVWEDALEQGFVAQVGCPGGQGATGVVLTPAGRVHLSEAAIAA